MQYFRMQMHARWDIETASIERERSIWSVPYRNLIYAHSHIHANYLFFSLFFFRTLRIVEWRLNSLPILTN